MSQVLEPGQTFVKWKVEKLLGEGGMGEVYLARDEWLCRDVAIKVLPVRVNDDPRFVDRMRREAAAGTTVRHPNLVEVIDGGLHEGEVAYVVMEYLKDAKTLRLVTHHAGRIDVADALAFLIQLADGVGALHAARILHRDLKPENVMVLRSGALKVIDFGLARIRTQALRTTVQPAGGGVFGTAHYMAPELLFGGTATPSSDVYAVGLIGHEMLTGKHVFQGATDAFPNRDEVTARHVLLEPPRVDDLVPGAPPALADLLVRMLAKDPDGRPSARDVGQELASILRALAEPPGARAPSADEMKTRPMPMLSRPLSAAADRAVEVLATEPMPAAIREQMMARSPSPSPVAVAAPAAASSVRAATRSASGPPAEELPREALHLLTPGPTTQPSRRAGASTSGPLVAVAVGLAVVLGGTVAYLAAQPSAPANAAASDAPGGPTAEAASTAVPAEIPFAAPPVLLEPAGAASTPSGASSTPPDTSAEAPPSPPPAASPAPPPERPSVNGAPTAVPPRSTAPAPTTSSDRPFGGPPPSRPPRPFGDEKPRDVWEREF